MTASNLDLSEFALADDITPPIPTAHVNLKKAYGLREYQANAIESTDAGWGGEDNISRQLIVSATGTGKTALISAFAKREMDRKGKVLVLAHTDELIDQAREKIAFFAKIRTEKEKSTHYASRFAPVVVGSVQTMCGDMRLSSWKPNHFSLVIVDECFPAGTLIDGRPIESIQVGEHVKSYNHDTNSIEYRKVLRVFKNTSKALVSIKLESGKVIYCTPGHPFFCEGEYIPAYKLRRGSIIYEEKIRLFSMQETSHKIRLQSQQAVRNILQPLQECSASSTEKEDPMPMQELRNHGSLRGPKAEPQKFSIGQNRSGLLLNILSRFMGKESFKSWIESSGIQSHAREGEDAPVKSNDESGCSRKDAPKKHWSHISFTWRKRKTYKAADSAKYRSWIARLTNGIRNRNIAGEGIVSVRSELLQGRHSDPRSKTSDRSRRPVAYSEEVEVSGSKENRDIVGARVESVEILEQASGSGVGSMCSDCTVYNFEVEGNNNYFAEGVLVHNCHRSLAKSYQKILTKFNEGGAKIVGVTATADRGDKRSLGEFFQRIAFEYNLLNAVRDGWLIRPIVQTMPLEIDLRGVETKKTANGNDLDQTQVARRLIPFLGAIAKQVAQAVPNGTYMFFMPSVETSQMMSDALNAIGIATDWVSGDREGRTDIIRKFKAGGLRALCNMAVLTEGFDHDKVDTIICLRPTKIRSLFVQIAGRASRPLNSIVGALNSANNALERRDIIAASSKKFYRILDFLWLYEKHDLIAPASLVTTKPEIAEQMRGKQGDLIEVEAQAERDLLAKLEKEVRKNQHKKGATLDPLEFATETHDVDLATYEPETANDALPPTQNQLHILSNNGIDTSKIKYRGHASLIYLKILKRHEMGLATFRQLHFLNQLGIDGAIMTRAQAQAAILANTGKAGA